MALAATVAVASTARTFSGTADEPAHLAAGMQWLTSGGYTYDLQHPPLGRIAAAIGPYLAGARGANDPAIYDEGARILGSGTHYVDTLAAARHGELVFFVLLLLVVWLWSRRLSGELGAAIATLLLVTNPNVLAHAGLATTDIACAATTTLALFLAARWVESPTLPRSLAFGGAAGLAVGSRLSALAFIGASLAVSYAAYAWVARRARIEREGDVPVWTQVGIGALVCCGLVWAVYRFAVGPVHPGGHSVPAPAFIAGVNTFLLHGSSGHPTFLLGTPSNRGWWYYFPVALAVKTPIPLLLLAAVGMAAAWTTVASRLAWAPAIPAVAALAIVGVSLAVRVDLGVRLVLPVYPLLAIAGAYGATRLWSDVSSAAPRIVVGGLLAWALVIVVRSHPDHLAYFNLLAGDHPEHVLVDSNLDWGQDLYRLRDTLAARGIRDSVRVAYFGTSDVDSIVPRARDLGLHERTTGWIAASETYLAGEWVGHAYAWLLDYPTVARIGPSMRLWYIPSATTDSSRR